MSKLLAAVGGALIAFAGVLACGVLLFPVGVGQAAPVDTLAPVVAVRGGMDGWQAGFFVALLLVIFGLFLLVLFRQMDHAVAMRQASHPPAPHILHTHPTEPARSLPAEKDTPLLPGPEPSRIVAVPTARALLAQGLIGPGRPMVFCWTAAGPLLGGPEQIFTTAIGGKGRSGKTRTAAWLIGQRVMHGARILGIDPHAHKADSLSRLLAPLASAFVLPLAGWNATAMDRVITQAEAFLEALRRGETLGPLLLVIDEYTLLMRQQSDLARRAARLVEAVATEGGGMGFHGLVIGQNWKGTRAGGTEVREMMNSAFVHRSWERQAGYLVPDADLAKAAESLVPGRAIFVPTDDDPQAVGIPLVEMADLAQMLALARPSAARFAPSAEAGATVPPSAAVYEPEIIPRGELVSDLGDLLDHNGRPLPADLIAQVRERYDRGLSSSDTLKDITGGKTGGDAAAKVGRIYHALVQQTRADLARVRQN